MHKIIEYFFGQKFKSLSATDNLINYYYNDPTTADLIGKIPETTRTNFPDRLEVKVDGYKGGGYNFGTPEQQAAQCKVTIDNVMNYVVTKMIKCPKHWASKKQLVVKPRAGKKLNAYYDRNFLKFFYFGDIFTSESSDVISHELGHAILDALRPDLFNVMSTEIWAFHESFGDCMSIINLLQHDIIIDKLLKNNSLNESNLITKIGEELGISLGRKDTLRDAFNDLKYIDPKKLPKNGDLTSDPHNFSRVFTGAWYEFLVRIYENNISMGLSQKKSLLLARDVGCEYLLASVVMAPATTRFYNAVVSQMMVYDKKKGNKYQSELISVFSKRNIYEAVMKVQCEELNDLQILQKNPQIDEVMDMFILKSKNEKDKFKTLNSSNKLYNMEFEIANESNYVFDRKGKFEFCIQSTNSEAYEDAYYCLDYIKNKNLLNTYFAINKNKIVRTAFSCCNGYINNSEIPGQPEYGRSYKPENHNGCGCGSKTTVTSSATRKNGCYVSHNIGGTNSIKIGSSASRKIC